jgi:tetratricopeptide (TPR) repeat protein
LDELNQALQLDPSYGVTLNLLAYAHAEMGDNEKALDYFKKYSDVSPGDADPLDSMAGLYFRMGRLDDAIAKYKEALEIKPDFGAERWISYIYSVKGEYTEAMNWTNLFIDAAPSEGLKAQGYLGLGFYQMVMGKFDVATQALDKAQEIWRADKNLYGLSVSNLMKGWIHFGIGEFELGREYIKKYFDFNIEFQPQLRQINLAGSNIFTGFCDLGERKTEAARKKLMKAGELLSESIEEAPQSETIKSFLYDLFLAEILLAEGSVDDAIEVMENAAPLEVPALNPPAIMSLNMPLYQDVLARAYIIKEEWDKAIAVYEDLIKFDPDSTDRRAVPLIYHYRLAKLYEQKGWKGKAIEHYEKFLEPWEGADSSPPQVADARKRLAELK